MKKDRSQETRLIQKKIIPQNMKNLLRRELFNFNIFQRWMQAVSINSKTVDWLCKRDCAAMITTSLFVACRALDTMTITKSSETDTGCKKKTHQEEQLHKVT